MVGRIPEDERFGRQNAARDRLERETRDALRIDGGSFDGPKFRRSVVRPVTVSTVETPTITGTLTEFATIDTPVPEGFSTALVLVHAQAGLRHDGSAGSWSLLTVSAAIESTPVMTGRTSINGTMYGLAVASGSSTLADLNPGDNVSVSAFVMFSGSYSVQSVSIAGTIIFLP